MTQESDWCASAQGSRHAVARSVIATDRLIGVIDQPKCANFRKRAKKFEYKYYEVFSVEFCSLACAAPQGYAEHSKGLVLPREEVMQSHAEPRLCGKLPSFLVY